MTSGDQSKATILLVGCGRMGSAMATAWAPAFRVLVHDPHAVPPPRTEQVRSLDGIEADIVVLAVKPQVFPDAAPALAQLAGEPLFLSIMAGLSLAGLSASLGGTRRLVRAMPNTPAAIGRGITAAVADRDVSDHEGGLVAQLLRATGELVWLDREADLDAVTAVSGSGPAYFFRFTEALARAGEQAGLDPALAMQLARATFSGAAALADQRPEPLSILRQEVTSPGGTTAAGLSVLDADGAIDRLVGDVVEKAAFRSRELGG